MFNPSSLIDIGWTVLAAAFFLILTALSREGFFLRKIDFSARVWVVLLLGFALSTVLEPAPKFFAAKATDSLVSLYRLGQWALAFVLLLGLYSRETKERAPAMLTQFMVRMCWGALIPIWLMVPLAPSLAYVSETARAIPFHAWVVSRCIPAWSRCWPASCFCTASSCCAATGAS